MDDIDKAIKKLEREARARARRKKTGAAVRKRNKALDWFPLR